MKKRLLLNLLLTLLLSMGITGLILSVWYNTVEMEFEERQATAIIFLFLTVFQNLAIAIFTLPILFQINNSNYSNKRTKNLYLLASPLLVTLILSVFYLSTTWDKINITFLVAPVSFYLINRFFYNRSIKTNA